MSPKVHPKFTRAILLHQLAPPFVGRGGDIHEVLRRNGMRVEVLGTWFDVDTEEDLERLRTTPIERIPHTASVLQRMRSADTSCTTGELSPDHT